MGVAISIVLVSTPFLFYLYLLAPDVENWNLGFINIPSGGFSSVKIFLHQLYTKSFMFVVLSIWFLTCMHWWKYAILVPMVMVLYQMAGVLQFSIEFVDHYDFWTSLPIVIPIIIIHVIISIKLKSAIQLSKAIDLKEHIEKDLNSLK